MILQGKTVLITGGSAGIGLEAAKQFLANGAKVIITGRDKKKLDQAKKAYPAVITIQSDVSSKDDVSLLLKQVQSLGGIDILYNNAGVISTPLNLGKPDDRHYERAAHEMSINYLGVIRLNNTFIEMLESREEAAIINTSSILSYVPANLVPTYAASKVAVRFYTQSLRDHLRIKKSNIKVFELLPPLVATDMAEGLDAKTMTPKQLVSELITGLKRDQLTIRVGTTKLLYIVSRLSPKLAFKLINPNKNAKLLG